MRIPGGISRKSWNNLRRNNWNYLSKVFPEATQRENNSLEEISEIFLKRNRQNFLRQFQREICSINISNNSRNDSNKYSWKNPWKEKANLAFFQDKTRQDLRFKLIISFLQRHMFGDFFLIISSYLLTFLDVCAEAHSISGGVYNYLRPHGTTRNFSYLPSLPNN